MGADSISNGDRFRLEPESGDGVSMLDPATLPVVEVRGVAHTITYASPAFCRLLGRAGTELTGMRFAEIAPGGPEGARVLDRMVETGESLRAEREDGSQASQWIYARWPAAGATGGVVGVIIQLSLDDDFRENVAAINGALLVSALRQHELTSTTLMLNARLEAEAAERKAAQAALREANARLADQADELEQVVAERTAKLRETVGDLEMFSYCVAHELRSPLRSMEGFARMILVGSAGRLDAASCGYLERIAHSAARMDRLVQDVLNYTGVARQVAELTPVDLRTLLADIISEHPNWQPPRAEIACEGAFPAVLGHDGLLTQCFSQLLGNAVKFVAPGVTPRVRVGAEEAGPLVRVWVEDNGIGIAEKDRARVFRMFDRIHPAERFEGSGIGMMIARKAVERMGGRIDFASASGSGSRFWIELKRAPQGLA